MYTMGSREGIPHSSREVSLMHGEVSLMHGGVSLMHGGRHLRAEGGTYAQREATPRREERLLRAECLFSSLV